MKLWGGYVEGELDFRLVDSGFGGWGKNFSNAPALFVRKEDAKREYEDVRRVEVTASDT